MTSQRKMAAAEAYVVLTDQRLLVLEPGWWWRPSSKVRTAFARRQVIPLRYKRSFMSTIDLAVGAWQEQVRLTFPRTERKESDHLAAVLDMQPA